MIHGVIKIKVSKAKCLCCNITDITQLKFRVIKKSTDIFFILCSAIKKNNTKKGYNIIIPLFYF
jgi:hypothetical protein